MPVELIGLTEDGTSLSVDDDLKVSPAAAPEDQDVVVEMKAAVAAASTSQIQPANTAAAKEAEDENAEGDDESAENTEADTGEQADEEQEAGAGSEEPGKESDAGESAGEKKDEGGDDTAKVERKEPEAKSGEKPEPGAGGQEPEEGEEAAARSEAETIVETIGGVEVLKSAQPLIEAGFAADMPVSEKLSRVERFFGEKPMEELRHEVFWQAVESEPIRDMLTADAEVREVFAQKVFGSSFDNVENLVTQAKALGVPFAYLEKLVNEERELLGEEDFATAVAEFKTEADDKPPAKKTEDPPAKKSEDPPAKETAKTEEKKTEEKKTEPPEISPVFQGVLDKLHDDVGAVLATGQLEVEDGDDAQTKELKIAASQRFVEEWPKRALADEKMSAAYTQIRALADQGREAQAQALYPAFARHAKRVAATLIDEVTKDLAAHRGRTQAKAKAIKQAPGDGAKGDKTKAAASGIDITSLKTEADVTRAMEEVAARHGQ